MNKHLKSFWHNTSGATAIEYGLIATFIALGMIIGVRLLAGNLGNMSNNTRDEIIDATD